MGLYVLNILTPDERAVVLNAINRTLKEVQIKPKLEIAGWEDEYPYFTVLLKVEEGVEMYGTRR